jgi:hypothetical protein
MDTDAFTQRLHGLTAEDIERVASVLRADLETVDGELTWWRATIEVTGALKREHRSRMAGLAAHRAATAVVDAARAAGIDDDEHRDRVTAVARAAAEAARALAAGVGDHLLHPWLDARLVAA